MLTVYKSSDGHLEQVSADRCGEAFWVDMHDPTPEEEHHVERSMQVQVPTREDMREVESSSALYRTHGATFLTVRVVQRDDNQQPRLVPLTLIVTRSVFVTLRYTQPKTFDQFLSRAFKPDTTFPSPLSAAMCFLETVVDRAADILEEIGDRLDPISLEIFSQNAGSTETIAAADLGRVLKGIGQNGDLASRVRESLHSVARSVPFLRMEHLDEHLGERLKTLESDVHSLLEHASFLQTQIQFLLDSNLGLISIQQNAIMKALSVAAVIFLPPTLIGSIYGMNFEKMPELHWRFGYLYGLGVMVLSAVGPLLYFRWKRWL